MINIVIKPFSNSVFFGFLVLLFCMFHLPHAYGNCFIERQKGNFVVDKKPDRINDSLFQRVKYLNQTGVQLRDSSLYKKALNFHFEALKLAEEIKDTSGLIHSLNNIGTDLRRTAAYMEASGYHYLALDLARSDKKYLKSKAIAMNGLGNIFLALEKCDYSLTYFEKALAIEIQLKSPLGQAINYANIGEAFRIKGQLDSALYYYNQSLLQNSIIDSKIGISICKKSIGCIWLVQGETDKGIQLLHEALDVINNSSDIFHKVDVQIAYCKALTDRGQINEALLLVNDILKSSVEIHSFESLYIAYGLLSKLNYKQERYQKAFEAKELAYMYRDSMQAQNSDVRIHEMEHRYKNKQASQEIQLLKAEKELSEKNRAAQRRIFFLLIFLLLVLAGFSYYSYYNRLRITRELKKINTMKSRFFGNVSHEFRTPLTLIKGPLEKWKEADIPQQLHEDICIMHRNTERLMFLVDQLLSMSKIDAGRFVVKPHQGDLALTIKGLARSFNSLADDKKLNYNVEIEESGRVYFDSEIVEIILINLLSNAFKYSSSNGDITVNGKSKDDSYTIYVANTGPHMSDEELNRMFDRFYSGSLSYQTGTGIGLSLVKELCGLYKASINVGYNKNGQIEFVVDLPVNLNNFDNCELIPEISIPENTVVAESLPAFSFDTARNETNEDLPLLLIVEDNDDMRQYLLCCFDGICTCKEAINGAEGIHIAREILPDIIISDVMMPQVTGIELCNTLKSDDLTSHIPVVLLTALAEEENMLEGLNCKADEYITKPFGAKILKVRILNLLALRQILSDKYRKEIMLKPFNTIIKGNENTFAQVLKDILENYITRSDFGVEEFCARAAMSRAQLHRKLKATVNMSATEFIRVHRVKVASELLGNDAMSIADVCFASGFNDASYFSKSFKEVFGVSPQEFRKG